jgi:Flp pilus assembly protein TadD
MRIAAMLLLCAAGSAWAAAPKGNPDAERCRAHGSVDTCYDAIRHSPSDPSLLAALGDAFAREKHTADALRAYRRAAGLAPADRSVIAKIAALEGKPVAKKVAAATPPRAVNDGASRRYSNAAPESESH